MKLRLAEDRFDAGLIDEAQACLQEASALNAELPGIANLAAKLALARGDWVQAEQVLTRACERQPTDPESLYLLGTVHQKNRHWQAADRCYRRAALAQPNDRDYALALAENLLVLDRPGEALDWLQARRQSFADEPAYCVLLAQCHELLGQYAQAAKEYAVTLGQVGEVAWLCEALAYAYYWSGQLAPAAEAFERATALIEKDGEQLSTAVQIAWADCLLATNRPQQARQRLGVLVRDHPREARLWMFLAVAWEACGDSPRALSCAQTACGLEPKSLEARLLQAVLAERAGRPELAQQLLEGSHSLATQDLLRHEVEACLGLSPPQTDEADQWVGPPYVASYPSPRVFSP